VFRQFSANDSGRLLVLGRLEASTTATPEELLDLAGRIDSATGSQMFGWSLLGESLMGIMEHDVKQVLIPIGVVLVTLLGLAFRKFGEIVLSLTTLGFSFMCLLAVMALLGWSWNLMNVMALPLLFGAGVDYSIHIQFALRRYYGDRSRVRKTVGRAILLCCASTATGFGTLGFANNAGCASLGRVCATGIIITGLVSVFLLPVWWYTLKVKEDGGLTATG
jgi:predicted RND superfamily exporter protein